MSDEINILDYAKVIYKWREFIISFTAAFVVLAVLICLVMPLSFKAETTLLIPQQSGKGLEGVLALSSMMSGSTVNMPTDLTQSLLGRTSNFSDILKSRTVAEMIINGLDLKSVWHMKSMEAMVRKLQRSMKVKEQKSLLKITVYANNPKLAADIANYAVIALDDFNVKGNFSYAKRMNVFVMEQLALAKIDLSDAEEKLKTFETQSYMVKLSEKELMLARLMRDVKVKEAVYTMLLQEYEKTKIDEAREDLFFEILDPAKVPSAPSAPRPLLYVVCAFILGIAASVSAAFTFEYLESVGVNIPKLDYNMEVEWRKIRRYLTGRK
jgi:uncharacterized protein involved in exopolysaccharide biosynthesis